MNEFIYNPNDQQKYAEIKASKNAHFSFVKAGIKRRDADMGTADTEVSVNSVQPVYWKKITTLKPELDTFRKLGDGYRAGCHVFIKEITHIH